MVAKCPAVVCQECFVVGTRQIDISADCFDFAKCFSSDTQLVCLVPDEIHLIK